MTEVMTMFKLREEMSKESENVVNRLHRHCRIGRVEKKFQTLGGMVKPPRSWFPDPIKSAPSPFFSGAMSTRSASGDAVINPAAICWIGSMSWQRRTGALTSWPWLTSAARSRLGQPTRDGAYQRRWNEQEWSRVECQS